MAGADLATLRSDQPAWVKGFAIIDLGSNATLLIPGVGEGVQGIKFGAKALLSVGGKIATGEIGRAEILRLVRERGVRWLGRTVVKCGACFPAGTLVATPRGSQAIERLAVGQAVLAEDPHTGTVEPEVVQAVIAHPVWPLMAVQVSDGSTITVTVEHPFWVDMAGGAGLGGWMLAGQLRAGDHLRTASGTDVLVVGLRYHVGRAAVYTLTVAKDHTFFVGSARLLVHNCDAQQILKLAGELQFTGTTARHMEEPFRAVSREILADAILHGRRMPDPQGAPGAIKIVSEIMLRGKRRELEIVFREADKTILHFLYKTIRNRP